MMECTCACLQASSMSASLASWRANRMFSRIESLTKNGNWASLDAWSRSEAMVDSGDVVAIEQNPPPMRIQKPQHEVEHRRLARSDATHQSHRLAFGDRE